MGIFQLDLTIKTAIELGIEDMRKNPWLIDHMLGDCIDNPYLKDKYGQKQIDACKEWFLQNNIEIKMTGVNDKDKMPLITIRPGRSPEKDDMKSMADQSTESVTLMPQTIGKPIGYIVKPFVPTSYDILTGIVGVPDDVNVSSVRAGMILVDPDKGEGFVILDVTAEGIEIEANIALDATQLAVLPEKPFYKARVEHSFFQQDCEIGCYTHGDPQATVWLHSIVLYSILRYREALLEAQGFAQSSLASSPLMDNPNYSGPNGEVSFMMAISLTGQVENTWIKTPRRFIESVQLREKKPKGYNGGIKILSNLDSPPFVDKSAETWYTTDGIEENDED